MSDVWFFGDSNAGFFNAAVNGTTQELRLKPESYWTGYEKQSFMGHDIHFFWQTTLAMTRVTPTYLNKRIREEAPGHLPTKESVIVFQFGRVDLQLKGYSFFELEKALSRYILDCYKFGQYYGARIVFTTPIANENSLDRSLANHFDNLLFYYCESLGIDSPIDITKIVGRSFPSEHWDEHLHLVEKDSVFVLEHIMGKIFNK